MKNTVKEKQAAQLDPTIHCFVKQKRKRTESSFWQRDDIRKSVQYIDGWAALVWNEIHGGTHIPAEILDGGDSAARRGSPSDMPGLFDAKITVEKALASLGNPWILRGLLLYIYPKEGTFARNCHLSNYRPATLIERKKEFGWSDEYLTKILESEEKRFLIHLAARL